jgi:hypothetical protein
MNGSAPPANRFSLRRWSQRKLAASRAVSSPTPPPVSPPAAAAPAPAAAAVPGTVAQPDAGVAAPVSVELPAIDSLSLESDFTPFLRPEVDDTLRRQALKKLFAQPAFNVMDGLDVYIDDYGKPDPIAPEIVRQLVQGRYLFDPPQTRVNAEGVVENVPPDAAADAVCAEPAATAAPVVAAALPAGDPEDVASVAASAVPEPRLPAPPPTGEPTP